MIYKYLLILLTIYSIPQYLYGACCIVNPVPAESHNVFQSVGDVAFFNGDCFAVLNPLPLNPSAATITTFSGFDCASLLNISTIGSEAVRTISVSPNGCVITTNFDALVPYSISGCALAVNVPGVAPIMPAGTTTVGAAFSPIGDCLVSANNGNNTVSVYSACGVPCAIADLMMSISTGAKTPANIAFSPILCNGFAFCAVLYSNASQVDLFQILQNCNLVFLGSIPTMGPGGTAMAFCPTLCNGKILLAVDILAQGTELLSIDPTTCTGTSVQFIDLTGQNYFFSSAYAFTPDGSCFISNDQFAPVVQLSVTNIYTVSPTTCTLTHAQGLNFGTNNTQGLAIRPDGQCMIITFPVSTTFGTINSYTFISNESTFSVNLSPALQVVCPGQSISLTANVSGGTGPFFFTFNGPNSFLTQGTNPSMSIPKPTTLNSGNYTVTVLDTGTGCETTSVPSQVVVKASNC